MKVAVSIPDKDFRAADAMAKQLNRSRSAFYAEALREFVARRSADSLTTAANLLADELNKHEVEMLTKAGAQTALSNTEW